MPWPSALPDRPFPSRAPAAVAAVAEALLAPGFWALDRLLALRPTTAQRARWRRHRAGRCLAVGARALAAPALLLALLLALPPALLGLLLWLPAQAKRRPFVYQHAATAPAPEPWDPRRARGFTFLTANLCLLPSGLARFSNLGGTRQRAALIARLLAPGRPIPLPDPMPPVLTAHIPPDTDFVCLQEVFDATAATTLRRQLGRRFPHVLWGVGPGGLRCGRLRVLGSGLVLGSRFPLLAARFHPFPNGAHEDALANKGLLVAQVLLGTGQGRRVVGYLGCTHLQAPAADGPIRDVQLSLVLRWLREFRREQERPRDLVAFDVLCGDLNFDNCSRGDAKNQEHPLFKEFWDPARCESGQEQPWAIGGDTTVTSPGTPVAPPDRGPQTLSHCVPMSPSRRTLSQPVGRCPIVSPCPHVPMSPCPHVPMSPCPIVQDAVPLCPHVPMSPCPCPHPAGRCRSPWDTVPLCPHVPMSPCPHVPMSPCPTPQDAVAARGTRAVPGGSHPVLWGAGPAGAAAVAGPEGGQGAAAEGPRAGHRE
uniref:sphingomyelin phosphodiesterase n=1 Tax=Taeniopygia guttata TaxID=59729 RepID=A0A674HU88_TAEGU